MKWFKTGLKKDLQFDASQSPIGCDAYNVDTRTVIAPDLNIRLITMTGILLFMDQFLYRWLRARLQ